MLTILLELAEAAEAGAPLILTAAEVQERQAEAELEAAVTANEERWRCGTHHHDSAGR